ncbi:MAG: thiamine pyrophosphate-dependent enzyme, partial [Thermoplasmata archaeon]
RGPALLECVTYRMTAHSSSDDPKRYQPAAWAGEAAAHDPVERLERWMVKHDLLTEDAVTVIEDEAERKVRAAIEAAEATPAPPATSLTEDVYAAPASARATPPE